MNKKQLLMGLLLLLNVPAVVYPSSDPSNLVKDRLAENASDELPGQLIGKMSDVIADPIELLAITLPLPIPNEEVLKQGLLGLEVKLDLQKENLEVKQVLAQQAEEDLKVKQKELAHLVDYSGRLELWDKRAQDCRPHSCDFDRLKEEMGSQIKEPQIKVWVGFNVPQPEEDYKNIQSMTKELDVMKLLY